VFLRQVQTVPMAGTNSSNGRNKQFQRQEQPVATAGTSGIDALHQQEGRLEL